MTLPALLRRAPGLVSATGIVVEAVIYSRSSPNIDDHSDYGCRPRVTDHIGCSAPILAMCDRLQHEVDCRRALMEIRAAQTRRAMAILSQARRSDGLIMSRGWCGAAGPAAHRRCRRLPPDA